MPTTRRSRTIDAPVEDVWDVVSDPHHLPRWWPRVTRVEGAEEGRFTQVLATAKGKPVRADFRVVESVPPRRQLWVQELEDSPFERLMGEALTEIGLEPADAATKVAIELRQRLRGFARFGWFLVRRANVRVLDEALDGLERACGR